MIERPDYLSEPAISNFVTAALSEDIGPGDYSTLGTISNDSISKAKLIVKDDGIIAGLEMAWHIFFQFSSKLNVEYFKKDGEEVKKGEIAFIVAGPSRAILSTERLVLNCMQRMSGIATYTNRLNEMIAGTRAKVTDTRKTTPNFRLMEKWAVAIGGGRNHRFALYDMVMLKDNHVDLAGGIKKAIENERSYLKRENKDLKIEIETRTLDEVQQVLEVGGVDIILLDNMHVDILKQAVTLIDGRYKTEASGGITEETIRAVAETGVDYISVGALTHSVKSLDLSLKVIV